MCSVQYLLAVRPLGCSLSTVPVWPFNFDFFGQISPKPKSFENQKFVPVRFEGMGHGFTNIGRIEKLSKSCLVWWTKKSAPRDSSELPTCAQSSWTDRVQNFVNVVALPVHVNQILSESVTILLELFPTDWFFGPRKWFTMYARVVTNPWWHNKKP